MKLTYRIHCVVRRSGRSNDGFALLIVLWAMVLLSLLGLTVTEAGRSETRIAGNLLEAAQAQTAADAAISVAKYHMLLKSRQHWAADGVTHRLAVGGASVRVAVVDQDGKLDPNESPPALIAALARALGMDDATAGKLADAMVDWRSPGDSATDATYQQQQRLFAPPHEAFQSNDEVAMVAYMTPQFWPRMQPYIDVFLQSTPDPALADGAMAVAITDAAKRDHVAMDPAAPDQPIVVLVTATAEIGKTRFTRQALLRFDLGNQQNFLTLGWTEGGAGGE